MPLQQYSSQLEERNSYTRSDLTEEKETDSVAVQETPVSERRRRSARTKTTKRASRDSSVRQTLTIIGALLMVNVLDAILFRVSLHTLGNRGALPAWFDSLWTVIGLLSIVGLGYFVGQFTKGSARISGIIISNLLFLSGWFSWLIFHAAQVHIDVWRVWSHMSWLYPATGLVTSIVTQIAIAEFVARRKKRSAVASANRYDD